MMRLPKQLPPVTLAAALAACASPSVETPAPPVVRAASETDTPAEAPAAGAAKAETSGEPGKKLEKVGMNRHGKVTSISLEDFFLLHQGGRALVFDARPSFFYGVSHIPGALSMPKSNCDERIRELDPVIREALASGKTIVVYCNGITCPDARSVAIHLSHFGHDAAVFSGGWKAWKNADMPTE